jgi:hypothetical protein
MATADNAQQDAQTPGTDIALSNPEDMVKFDPNDLRAMSSFEDAQRILSSYLGAEDAPLVDASYEIGDGFTMLDNKDALLDVPFIAVQWRFAPGDYGQEFVIMRVLTQSGDKFVVVDGGTGICDQMRQYTQRTKRTVGMLVPRGLRKSEYTNEFGPGTTHYLNV